MTTQAKIDHFDIDNFEYECWAVRVGLAWTDPGDHGLPRYAWWSERGYNLEARLDLDENGWLMQGVDLVGHFTNHWEPGAIENDHFKYRLQKWFVPADHNNARALYDRACRYCFNDWTYQVLTVTVTRADVQLGVATVAGVESDCKERDLIALVFKLKTEAIQSARLRLRELWGEC